MRMLGYGAYMSCLYAVMCGLLLATTNSTSLRLFVPMVLGVVAVTGAAVARRARLGGPRRFRRPAVLHFPDPEAVPLRARRHRTAHAHGTSGWRVPGRRGSTARDDRRWDTAQQRAHGRLCDRAAPSADRLRAALPRPRRGRVQRGIVGSRLELLRPLAGVLLRSVPLAGLMSLPFAVATAWPMSALLALALFNLCSLMMVQWFVVPIMQRRYGLWAAAWVGYALLLLVAPQACLIAPLAALAVLAAATVRRSVITRPRSTPGVLPAFLRGSMQGTLVWLNPFLLSLTAGQAFQPTTAFLALLPAVLLFNIYFASVGHRTTVRLHGLPERAARRAALEDAHDARAVDQTGRA